MYSLFPLQINIFFQEHIRTDTEICFCVVYSGYFNLLDKSDKNNRWLWIEFN